MSFKTLTQRTVASLCLVASSLLHAESDYTLGAGLQVGTLPIYIGGYFSVDYRKSDDEQRYRIDDIALLSYGGNSTLSYMLELEYKELYVHTQNGSDSTVERDTHLYIERAHLDYNINEHFRLRLGKYNSPIGFWNLVHINVLRETTSNPVSSYILYPMFTTGANLTYNSFHKAAWRIDLIAQRGKAIDNGYNNYAIDRHFGVGITYEKEDFTCKISGGYFRQLQHRDDPDIYYALIAAKYETDTYAVKTELGSQRSDKEVTTAYAGYLQGAYYFTERHIGIARLEAYQNDLLDESDRFVILGYTYRPLYPVALKSEYQWHTRYRDNKLLLSLSVLF